MSTPENPASMDPQPPVRKRRLWLAVLIAIVTFFVGIGIGSAAAGGASTTAVPGSAVTVTEKAKPAPTVTVTKEADTPYSYEMLEEEIAALKEERDALEAELEADRELGESEEAVEGPEKETASEMTAGQEQALRSAEDYLGYSAFSKKGLREQLEYEEYSEADAKWAANHVDADWNEQAERAGVAYLEYSSFSESELAEQLEYEGFTPEQARHGASAAYAAQ